MNCPKCNNEIREGVSFCGNCGYRIKPSNSKLVISIVVVSMVIIVLAVINSRKNGQEVIQDTVVETDGVGNPVVKARCFPTNNPKYKTTGNARFDFWFDIPAEWDAVDRSANGAGFDFLTNIDDVQAGAWGANKVFTDEEYYDEIFKNKSVFEDFMFADGVIGKYIQEENTHNYIRNEQDRRIQFSITCSPELFKDNQDIIMHIAKSLRPGSHMARKIYFNLSFSDDAEVQSDLDYYASNIKNSQFVKENEIEIIFSDKYPENAIVLVEGEKILKSGSVATDVDIISEAKEYFKILDTEY